jgi:hypothetical protein
MQNARVIYHALTGVTLIRIHVNVIVWQTTSASIVNYLIVALIQMNVLYLNKIIVITAMKLNIIAHLNVDYVKPMKGKLIQIHDFLNDSFKLTIIAISSNIAVLKKAFLVKN